MRVFLFLFFTIICKLLISQCVGIQSFTINPLPPVGGYTPGSSITVCYTMQGWNGVNVQSNWLEGFHVNIGPGWSSILPIGPPINCPEGGGAGNWLWLNTTTSSSTGITVGPGWFFNSQQGCFPCNNLIAGEDWGDFGINCTWSFCFTLTVSNLCIPQNLLIQVTAGADGTWGSWGNNTCPTIPLNIYNGTSDPQDLPPLGSIFHN